MPRQIVEWAQIDRGRGVGASEFLIEPRRDLFQTSLNRRQRFRRRRAFDLAARFGEKSSNLGRLEIGRGARAELLDAVGKFADPPLHPLKRRSA